jgi:DNA repair protein RecN (Recombination protein N)
VLTQLNIANFAIIDRLSVPLKPGLNVLTGETGAGKSIIVDAVGVLLGGRVGTEVIRAGADQAFIEGVFDQPADPALASILDEHDLGDGDQVVLSRAINASGRSVGRVNGRAVPLPVLQAVGQRLVDIHGQTEHISLLRVAEHVDYLDGYAGCADARARVAASVAELRRVRRELDALVKDERELARRVDLLRFQIDEISVARLRPGEDDDLHHERDLLANAERLSAAADSAYKLLNEAEEGSTALDMLGQSGSLLEEIASFDPRAADQRRALDDAVFQLEDVARWLVRYRDSSEADPGRLEVVEERLDAIARLKRKYGTTIEEIVAFGEHAAAELSEIDRRDERISELQTRERDLLASIATLAEGLSAARRDASDSLSRAIIRELADLRMARAVFGVSLTREERADGLPLSDGRRYAFDGTGVDQVEFVIAANPGEPPKPLARVASGGETSRLMLALKTVLARADTIPVLIFDEIDSGISGRVGYTVGSKLAALSSERQVICVTHLPQIAAFADAHFGIEKRVSADRTYTHIEELQPERRVAELAGMLGGADASEHARANARDLLERAARDRRNPINGES